MSKFLPASGLKWIDPKVFDLNKCKFKYINKYNQKDVFLNFILNNLKSYENYTMIML